LFGEELSFSSAMKIAVDFIDWLPGLDDIDNNLSDDF
jgi:hypothetical protein